MLFCHDETTLVLIKPDAVKRDLAIDILKILTTKTGLYIDDIYEDTPSPEKIEAHLSYRGNAFEHTARQTLKKCQKNGVDIKATTMSDKSISEIATMIKSYYVDYISSGPLLAVSISGERAISKTKALCGDTFPAEANPQSIRGKFGSDSFEICIRENRAAHNLIHSAESSLEAFHQYHIWFPQNKSVSTPQP